MGPKPPVVPLRVVSLLPSATENFYALLKYAKERRGLTPSSSSSSSTSIAGLPELVGRSHECDFPATPDVQALPVLTAARTAFTTSADVHKQVREALADASSLYHLDAAALVALAPDVILTQSTCKVCSIDLSSVKNVLDPSSSSSSSSSTSCTNVGESRGEIPAIPGKTAAIVTTNPISLVDVLVNQFQLLGRALGLEDEGNAIAQYHLERLQALQALGRTRRAVNAAQGKAPPRVLLVEWLDPLFIGKMGWMREIIEHASSDVVESLEKPPSPIDIVIVACCGLSINKTEQEIVAGRVGDWWTQVVDAKAEVYLVDGMAMFSRPTPKLLAALEWLVHLAHGGADAEQYFRTTTFPFKRFDFAAAMEHVASTSKEAAKKKELLDIEELHRHACDHKQAMYTDPATGYSVMTAYNLQLKQVCCGNGCRHCPFGHVNVKDPLQRTNKLTDTVVLQPKKRQRGTRVGGTLLWPIDRRNAHVEETTDIAQRDLIVVFWSGGKDSFLALTTLYAQYAAQDTTPMPRVVLLTSIDPVTHTVPIQNISHATIVAQANALGLPVCIVAVGLGHAYASQLHAALSELPHRLMDKRGMPHAIHSLVFGDLHLEDIRAWREATFGDNYTLQFPLWKHDYQTDLLPLLRSTCARIEASVVFSNIESDVLQDDGIKVGDIYNETRLAALNAKRSTGSKETAIDLMGESGEFHTCVVLPGMLVE